MSLRNRLALLILMLMGLGLGTATALAAWQATQQLRTELTAALLVGVQTVRGDASARDNPMRLVGLVAEFNGDRHVQAVLLGSDGEVLGASTLASSGSAVPRWFAALVGQVPSPIVIRQGAGTVLLRADPSNELLEIWGNLRDEVFGFALFCAPLLLLVHLTLRLALRPLADIADGLGRIEAGDRAVRVPARGPPELAGLARGFNRMSGRLDDVDARNASLTEQMLSLQEEERADLARDLHDEVGPALFSVTMTTAAILTRLREPASGEPAPSDPGTGPPCPVARRLGLEIAEEVRLIQDSIGHVQRHVRDILGRLRPLCATEFGLQVALDGLAGFWRARDPSLSITLLVALEPRPSTAIEEALYRVVQEGLSNAVRHGCPSRIAVVVRRTPSGVVAEIRNDARAALARGTTQDPAHGSGRGIVGMRERVSALSGTLSAGPEERSGGWVVRAGIPEARPAPAGSDHAGGMDEGGTGGGPSGDRRMALHRPGCGLWTDRGYGDGADEHPHSR